jgi:hypothetical protein
MQNRTETDQPLIQRIESLERTNRRMPIIDAAMAQRLAGTYVTPNGGKFQVVMKPGSGLFVVFAGAPEQKLIPYKGLKFRSEIDEYIRRSDENLEEWATLKAELSRLKAPAEEKAPQSPKDRLKGIKQAPADMDATQQLEFYALQTLEAHPEIIEVMNRVRQPFNVSSLAQVAALAALGDEAYIQKAVEATRHAVRSLSAALDTLGVRYVPSRANFILAEFDDATRVCEQLFKQGVMVRPMTSFGLERALRITVGTPEENARLVDALRTIRGKGARPA